MVHPLDPPLCTNANVNELKKRMKDSLKKVICSLKKVILWTNGCSSHFRIKYVFTLTMHFDKSEQLEWHYNEAHHEKLPMDGVDEAIKRVVFGLLKSNKIKISTTE